MSQPLMPLATAVWLVENTTLTFEQIADYCQMHEMEVQSIADGETGQNIEGHNPILLGQLSEENLNMAQKDSNKKLILIEISTPKVAGKKTKRVKYIPIAKRRDKPDAIAWLVKNHPDIPESKIVKLIGTTKKTIEAIKNRSYANMSQVQAKDPVLLGLCTQIELDELISKFSKAITAATENEAAES